MKPYAPPPSNVFVIMTVSLSYFRKAEGYNPHPDHPNIDPALHGTVGPAKVTHGPIAVSKRLTWN